jgi:hypothetical protein
LRQLKAQAQGQLELALAVESCAVGIGDGAEAGVAIGPAQEREARVAARCAGSVDDVAGGVDVGGVLVVEYIEDFADDFKVVALADVRVLGEARVYIVDARIAEGIAANGGDAVVATGAVDAGAQAADFGGWADAEKELLVRAFQVGNGACGAHRERQTSAEFDDGCKEVAVGEVAPESMNAPGGMRDGAAGDAVANVEVGVAVFELEVRGIEHVVEVGEVLSFWL